MFLVLAAIHSAGFVGPGPAPYPVVASSFPGWRKFGNRSTSCTRCSCSGSFPRPPRSSARRLVPIRPWRWLEASRSSCRSRARRCCTCSSNGRRCWLGICPQSAGWPRRRHDREAPSSKLGPNPEARCITPSSTTSSHRRPFAATRRWYVAKARDAGGPILELGAGTERITLEIAQAGCRIRALDADQSMLDRLQQKLTSLAPDVRDRVSVTVGDMRLFALADELALVIAPFRAFLHNLTEAGPTCLSRARPRAPAAGRAFRLQRLPSVARVHGEQCRCTAPVSGDGSAHSHMTMAGGSSVPKRRNTTPSGSSCSPSIASRSSARTALCSGPRCTACTLSYLDPPDIRRLLKEAGFASVHIAGAFDGRPFENDTDELVIEAATQ